MAYNVLIVDDSAIVRRVLMKTFGMTNIEVNDFYQAENGRVALDLLKENWIDVIFLDINMPVMNGMEFIQCLRTDSAIAETPVVIVSTEGSKERKEELQALGIKAYLRKPVTPETLVETLEDVFGEIAHAKQS